MKNYIYILLGSILLFSGCKENSINANNLNGKWVLSEAQCYCWFGENYNFNKHTIDFDFESQKVQIQNNEQIDFIEKTGVYPFKVKDNEVTINNDKSYTFEISENQMRLIFKDEPMIADDELTLIYKR
jgi:hypothetical protein